MEPLVAAVVPRGAAPIAAAFPGQKLESAPLRRIIDHAEGLQENKTSTPIIFISGGVSCQWKSSGVTKQVGRGRIQGEALDYYGMSRGGDGMQSSIEGSRHLEP